MSRHDKRAAASAARKAPTVSPALLQTQVKKLAHERQQLNAMLIAICKEQGRIRVTREVIEGLTEADGLDAREVGPHIYLEYVQSNMVVPGGVEGGQPKGAE